MTCKHCGKEVSANDKICPHCHEDLVKNAGRQSTSTGAKIIVGCAFALAGVFVLGIFAAIAIPKFANTKEKAYVASMRTDLRALRTGEIAYFDAHHAFSKDPALLKASGSNTLEFTDVSDNGWSATATNPNTAISCRIGMRSDSIPTVGDGVIQCLNFQASR